MTATERIKRLAVKWLKFSSQAVEAITPLRPSSPPFNNVWSEWVSFKSNIMRDKKDMAPKAVINAFGATYYLGKGHALLPPKHHKNLCKTYFLRLTRVCPSLFFNLLLSNLPSAALDCRMFFPVASLDKHVTN